MKTKKCRDMNYGSGDKTGVKVRGQIWELELTGLVRSWLKVGRRKR